MIGRQGARPLIPARREGAGPAACSAPGLRAPTDPAATAPPLSPACGGRCRSTEWRWRTGVSFRSCRRHLRVCGAGGREGTRGCSWSGLLSGDGPPVALLFRRRRPPPAPSRRSPGPRREKKGRRGAGGAGWWTRAWRKLLPDP